MGRIVGEQPAGHAVPGFGSPPSWRAAAAYAAVAREVLDEAYGEPSEPEARGEPPAPEAADEGEALLAARGPLQALPQGSPPCGPRIGGSPEQKVPDIWGRMSPRPARPRSGVMGKERSRPRSAKAKISEEVLAQARLVVVAEAQRKNLTLLDATEQRLRETLQARRAQAQSPRMGAPASPPAGHGPTPRSSTPTAAASPPWGLEASTPAAPEHLVQTMSIPESPPAEERQRNRPSSAPVEARQRRPLTARRTHTAGAGASGAGGTGSSSSGCGGTGGKAASPGSARPASASGASPHLLQTSLPPSDEEEYEALVAHRERANHWIWETCPVKGRVVEDQALWVEQRNRRAEERRFQDQVMKRLAKKGLSFHEWQRSQIEARFERRNNVVTRVFSKSNRRPDLQLPR